MIISRKDGQILKNFLENQPPEKVKHASLQAEFILKNLEKYVVWNFWYTSQSDEARDFFKYFKEYADQFNEEDLIFEPRIVTWSCPNCD